LISSSLLDLCSISLLFLLTAELLSAFPGNLVSMA
jgi:hypothetical protein